MKLPSFIGIFIFIGRENFTFSWFECEKSFITSGPDLWLCESFIYLFISPFHPWVCFFSDVNSSVFKSVHAEPLLQLGLSVKNETVANNSVAPDDLQGPVMAFALYWYIIQYALEL